MMPIKPAAMIRLREKIRHKGQTFLISDGVRVPTELLDDDTLLCEVGTALYQCCLSEVVIERIEHLEQTIKAMKK